MSKAYSIRHLRMEGDSIAELSRKFWVSRNTVYKNLAADDLSPKPPVEIAGLAVEGVVDYKPGIPFEPRLWGGRARRTRLRADSLCDMRGQGRGRQI